MTISTTTSRVTYAGDGTNVAFAVPFVFFGNDEVEVIEKLIATGIETTKTLGTHYNVAGGNGLTGTVTAVTAPAATVTWTLARKTKRTQLTDYTPNDPFPADTHERALDRLTTIAQEIDDASARSLKLSKTTGITDLTLPDPGAGKLLGYNALGTAIELKDVALLGAVTDATETVAGIAELATQVETNAGTDDARIVTPLKVATYVTVAIAAIFLSPKSVTGLWTFTKAKMAAITLIDGATVNWDAATGQVAKLMLGGNRVLAAPTNLQDGAFYSLTVLQDATGSRTLAWNAVFKFKSGTAPTLTATANARDEFVFQSDGTNLYEKGRNMDVK